MRFGIIGCGHIAKKHRDAIAELPNAELVAICDTNEETLATFADNVKKYNDLENILQDDDIDIVCICTPSGLHPSMTIKAAQYKKHIIIEKPIALEIDLVNLMIQACEENNVKLAVVHPNRFRPVIKLLKDKIDNNSFGKISHINATIRWNRDQSYYGQAPWRGTAAMDGGVLMNQAIHNIDLMLSLAPSKVKEVMAYTATRFRDIECEDLAAAVLKFEDGSLGLLEATVNIYPSNLEESISIFGSKGTAKIGGVIADKIQVWNFEDEQDISASSNESNQNISGIKMIIDNMIGAVLEDKKPIVSGEIARESILLIKAIETSAKQNRPVTIIDIENIRK